MVVLLCAVFLVSIVLHAFSLHDWGCYFSSLIYPITAVLYFNKIKRRKVYFGWFLILYSASELMVFLKTVLSFEAYYYVGNVLYFLAYAFLITEIAKSLSLKVVVKRFKIQFFVLFTLSIYVVHLLQDIVKSFVENKGQYYLELSYNVVMFILLTFASINYFVKDNVKSLYLFLGVLCLVFAEIIWVAHTYIASRELLEICSITLNTLACYLLFRQSVLFDVKSDLQLTEID